MAKHNELGKQGEQIAAEYLTQNSFVILEQNWRYKRNEIDIIAIEGDVLVFIEIKTRSQAYYGEPAAQVADAQMERISKMATVYMDKIGYDWEIRFDIIGILWKGPQSAQVKHFRDVWFDGW